MKINRCISKYNHEHMYNKQNKYIMVHYVGALGDAKANAEYYGGGDRQASANYYVGFAGDIYQVVEDFDRAWSAGINFGGKLWGIVSDYNSISIEMCVKKKNTKSLSPYDKDWYFEKATIDSTVELIAELMKKYNIPLENVVRHYDVCGKICPNPYVDSIHKGEWDKFKNKIKDKMYEKPTSCGSVRVIKSGLYAYNSYVAKSGKKVKVPIGTYDVIETKINKYKHLWGKLKYAGWIYLGDNKVQYKK